MTTAVIVDIIRTPSGKGKPGGALSGVHPAALLAQTLTALVERSGLDTALVDDVIAGCVGQIGDQSLNIARTALLAAGFPESVPGTTVDRQCGSSQQAAHFAAQGVIAGAYDIVIACGVESMSRVPIGSSRAGRNPVEPLAERYPVGLANQGIGAELIAARWKLDREALDTYSARSHARAAATAASGGFDNEIIPVRLPDGSSHTADETVRPGTTAEGLAGLKPAYYTPAYAERFPEIAWYVTAGSSSPLTDGASAVLVCSEDYAKKNGLEVIAFVKSVAVCGCEPDIMGIGPVGATRKALARAGLEAKQLDVVELNEAFASQAIACMRELGLSADQVNIDGGAIALGHPLGATGARIVGKAASVLKREKGKYALATQCIGGGQGIATVLEAA